MVPLDDAGPYVTMNWFRSRAKYGATLALLALALQFVLSFGHFHGDAAQAAPAIHAVAPSASTAVERSDNPQPAIEANQQQPDSDHPSGPHHDGYCAICAVMSLAGSLITSEPPLLLLPRAYHLLTLTTDAEFSHIASPRGVFQPRAPPAS
jgi:hypothetical protein